VASYSPLTLGTIFNIGNTQTATCTTSGNHIEVASSGSFMWLMRISAVTISGTVSFKINCSESAMTTNAQPGVRVVRVSNAGSILSDVVANANAGHIPGVEAGTAIAAQSWTATPTSTAFSDGDWLGVIVHADGIGGMSTGTFSFKFGDSLANTGDSNVIFTETITAFGAPASVPRGDTAPVYTQIIPQ
jgi:hypothetical protein